MIHCLNLPINFWYFDFIGCYEQSSHRTIRHHSLNWDRKPHLSKMRRSATFMYSHTHDFRALYNAYDPGCRILDPLFLMKVIYIPRGKWQLILKFNRIIRQYELTLSSQLRALKYPKFYSRYFSDFCIAENLRLTDNFIYWFLSEPLFKLKKNEKIEEDRVKGDFKHRRIIKDR